MCKARGVTQKVFVKCRKCQVGLCIKKTCFEDYHTDTVLTSRATSLRKTGESSQYEVCSKKDRTFAIKTLLLILQHFKHCPPQSSPLYWQYTNSTRQHYCCLLQRYFRDISLPMSSRKYPCRGWQLRWRRCWTRIMRSFPGLMGDDYRCV